MRIVFTLFISVLLLSATHAQQSRQFSFKQFSVNNGLASNSVLKVVQDKDGYIWLATANGLQRYDGNSFLTFKPDKKDPQSVPDVRIPLLYADTKKNLWLMGDNRKIGIFDTRKFTFRNIEVEDPRPAFFILQSFFELPGGELMLLKDDGNFLIYDSAASKFKPTKGFMPRPPDWRMNWLFWDDHVKKYWMSCDSGLVQYDPVTKHLNYRGHNIDNDPVIKAFANQHYPERVFVDSGANVIFIHWEPHAAHPQLHRFNRRTGKAEVFNIPGLGYYEAEYFLQQRNGRLWVYGRPFFTEWTNNKKEPFRMIPNVYRNEQSIRFDYMHGVFEDMQSNIWLATDNGLFVFNPDQQIFNTYYFAKYGEKSAQEAPVQSMEQLKDERLLVGSWGSYGVTCYDKDLNPVPLPPFPAGELSTWNMTTHKPSGNVWICMQGGSIVVFNPKTNSFKRYIPEVFGLSTIRQVDGDNEGNLWFGTQNGKIVKWDYKRSGGDPSKGYELVLQTGLVHKLKFDGKQNLWIAVLGRGLLQLDVRTGKHVKTITAEGKGGEVLFNNNPTDICIYNDTTLIVTAGSINILNTRTNKISFITSEDGLPSNTTVSVAKDRKGIVWVAMTNGVCRVNLQRKLVTYFDRRDGIADDKFSLASAKELNDGRLSFFTDHSFMIFDPLKINQQKLPPKPLITEFKLAGRPLNIDSLFRSERALLSHNNTSISINFSALSYLQQNKLLYYYMLEGLDNDWIRIDKPIEAVYNYLPPGNYTFKVKTESTDGISNPAIAALSIDVRSPFWKTWWFLSMISLLIILVLYMLDKERMKKRRAIHILRNQIRTNLKEEVSTSLNNINILSEMAKLKVDKDPVQTKNFIEQISEKSRNITDVMNDTLWSIDPENDSMLHTLEKMQELSDEMNRSSDSTVEFTAENKIFNLQLDMKLRHDLFVYYKECLQYLIYNLHAANLFVSVKVVRSQIQLEILAETEETNLADIEDGLGEATNKRIKAMKATQDIFSEKNNLSVVLQLNVKA
jgi:ligand-binding sensor domain-containing protein